MSLLAASVAGAVGAMLRYVVSGWVQGRSRSDFPFGTLTINLVGSFSLGLVVGAGHPESMVTLAVVGFLGGFTTYSTWMVETIRLGATSRRGVINLASSLIAGVAVAALGYILTS